MKKRLFIGSAILVSIFMAFVSASAPICSAAPLPLPNYTGSSGSSSSSGSASTSLGLPNFFNKPVDVLESATRVAAAKVACQRGSEKACEQYRNLIRAETTTKKPSSSSSIGASSGGGGSGDGASSGGSGTTSSGGSGATTSGGNSTPATSSGGTSSISDDSSDASGTTTVPMTGNCVNTAILFGGGEVCDDDNGDSIFQLLYNVVDIMTIGVGILGVIGITIAGIQYLTAGGSEEKTRKAKRRIFEIVIGLVAYALFYAILKWLNISPPPPST
ncbi:hypothetical protein IIY24_02055 [Candidatus Saccharibacteria bacterium]|nr:hypothetical protein [Candidatus Saccharibacteria bacterium]